MSRFIIEGGQPLKGTIEVVGAKNSAASILPASLLTDEECEISNLPLIEDIFRLEKILVSLGAKITGEGQRKIKIRCDSINPQSLDLESVAKIRMSILILGGLLQRFKKIRIPMPGGCKIGARPIDSHLRVFEALGASITPEGDFFQLEVKDRLKGNKIILDEFSVTATENALLAAVLAEGETLIKTAAAEPYIIDLVNCLKKMGAKISGEGTHTLRIQGVKKLHGFQHAIINDPIEMGTFIILAAAAKGEVKIVNIDPEIIELELVKFEEAKINFRIEGNSVVVKPSHGLKALKKIEARPYPGFQTDLLGPMATLMTQAQGTSLIHDTMYEGRIKNYIPQLVEMGADATICDPHRAVVVGPTSLFGREITSFDLRAGATLIIAALIAEGKSIIENAYQVDRGYERIEERLRKLGAEIKRED